VDKHFRGQYVLNVFARVEIRDKKSRISTLANTFKTNTI